MSKAIKLVVALFIVIISLGYFLPAMIAWTNGRRNTSAIFALNFFLGWTLIGWVVALVWSLKE